EGNRGRCRQVGGRRGTFRAVREQERGSLPAELATIVAERTVQNWRRLLRNGLCNARRRPPAQSPVAITVAGSTIKTTVRSFARVRWTTPLGTVSPCRGSSVTVPPSR